MMERMEVLAKGKKNEGLKYAVLNMMIIAFYLFCLPVSGQQVKQNIQTENESPREIINQGISSTKNSKKSLSQYSCWELSGDYYVKTGGDFSSLKDAADHYNLCGISKNSRLIVSEDLLEIATAEFKGTAPGSQNYTLTITTDGQKRIISGDIDGPVVLLSAANNIIFNGIDSVTNSTPTVNKLVIRNTNTTGTLQTALAVKKLVSDHGKNILIRNTEMSTLSAVNGIICEIDANNVWVRGCYLHGGLRGISVSNVLSSFLMYNVVDTVSRFGIYLNNSTNGSALNYSVMGNYVKNIKNTIVNTAAYGIYANGSFGTSHATGNWNISANTIDSVYNPAVGSSCNSYGIFSNFAGNQILNENNVRKIRTDNGAFSGGIAGISNLSGKITISNSVVNGVSGYTRADGILGQAPGTSSFLIESNRVQDINNLGTNNKQIGSGIVANGSGKVLSNAIEAVKNPNGFSIGIIGQNPGSANISIQYANNMVNNVMGKVSLGIHVVGPNVSHNILQNTVRLLNKYSAGDQAACMSIGDRYSAASLVSNVNLRNNVLVNEITGGDTENFVLLLQQGSTFGAIMDNRYHTADGNVAKQVTDAPSGAGTQNGNTYTTLSNWQSFATLDNSKFQLPVFVSNTDLHLAGSSISDKTLTAPFLSGVVVSDFDGDARSQCNNGVGADNFNTGLTITNAQMNNALCPGGSASVTATISNGTPPYWYSFDGGSTFYNVTNVSGNLITIPIPNPVNATFYLTIKDAANCNVTSPAPLITVNPVQRTAIISGPDSICINTPVVYEDLSAYPEDDFFRWTVDGGTVISGHNTRRIEILWNTTGDKDLTLSYETKDACPVNQGSKTVFVNSLPTAAMPSTPPASPCIGDTVGLVVTFTGLAPWSFVYSDGVSNYTVRGIQGNQYTLRVAPKVATTYSLVSVSDWLGCTSNPSSSVHVSVNPLPIVNFIYKTDDGNSYNCTFTDKSTVDGTSQVVYWYWEFGDGTDGNTRNPVHQYPGKGIYDVTLYATTNNSCTSKVVKSVEIKDMNTGSNVRADFTVNNSNQCLTGNSFRFDNKSIVTAPNVLQGYRWSFGDGQTSTDTSPVHSYTQGGSYMVRLIVLGSQANDTLIKTVNVYQTQVSKPVDQSLCSGSKTSEVVFNGDADIYNWSGGASIGLPDGSDSYHIPSFIAVNNTNKSVINTISVTPVMKVSPGLTCYGNPVQFQIAVNPLPVPTLSGSNDVCLGSEFVYTTEAGMNNYVWNVIGGEIRSGGGIFNNTVTVRWNGSGSGMVSVNYSSAQGCSGISPATLMVNLRPGALITVQPESHQSVCTGEAFQLSVTASGPGLSYQWYHNDQIVLGATSSTYRVENCEESDRGNYYVRVKSTCNTVNSDIAKVDIGLMSNIVVQKWSNVLAVKSLPEENGGYQFKAFQWYENGISLTGETKSYLHLNGELDYTALYSVRLTTVSDEIFQTCPIRLVPKDNLSLLVYPNPVLKGQKVQIEADYAETDGIQLEYILINNMGQILERQSVEGKTTDLKVPEVSGVYLLKVKANTGETKEFKIVVK